MAVSGTSTKIAETVDCQEPGRNTGGPKLGRNIEQGMQAKPSRQQFHSGASCSVAT